MAEADSQSEHKPLPKRPGDWFARLITETLSRYAKRASADYLLKKYPGLPKDLIADRYVTQQSRMAALAGAASATVISGAAIGSLALVSTGIGIPALAITIPVGIAAFAVEMGYTVRLQLKTAFDLCNLYTLRMNPDDPEDMQEIFALGMGLKAGELTGNAIQRLAPSIASQQARRLMRTGVRRAIQDWAAKNMSRTIARRYLTEKFLLSAVVPGLSIVLASGWNYYFTRGLGRAIRLRVRGRGMSAELVREIAIPPTVAPDFLLATALNVISTDSRISENELVAYKELAASLRGTHPDFVPENLASQWGDYEYWTAKTDSLSDEGARKITYQIAETMAVVDGRVDNREIKKLRGMAKILGAHFDKDKLKRRARAFYIQPAGRGCAIIATVLGLSLAIAGCACSLWLVYFGANIVAQ